MSEFIDMLKQRLDDAQKRLQETQNYLQQAQARHQAVAQEFTSLQTLINLENARAQKAAQESARAVVVPVKDPVFNLPVMTAFPVNATQAVAGAVSGANAAPEINKTQMIREVLRQHTNGISPAQVWLNVKDDVERNYVYSVLKRMKDKGEVKERRGKYYLQVVSSKEEEDNSQAMS